VLTGGNGYSISAIIGMFQYSLQVFAVTLGFPVWVAIAVGYVDGDSLWIF
jgi:hypothetical protein